MNLIRNLKIVAFELHVQIVFSLMMDGVRGYLCDGVVSRWVGCGGSDRSKGMVSTVKVGGE